MKPRCLKALSALALAGALACGFQPVVLAEETLEPETKEELRCISLMSIQSVKVLDNRRILFNLKGEKQYINLLPHRCFGLRKNQPFMYRTSLNQLCDLDLITVLDTGGFGMRPLGSCGLGRFYLAKPQDLVPITDDLEMKDAQEE